MYASLYVFFALLALNVSAMLVFVVLIIHILLIIVIIICFVSKCCLPVITFMNALHIINLIISISHNTPSLIKVLFVSLNFCWSS